MLSLFLNTPDVFTEDFIIDELIDFLIAGVMTTKFSSTTMLLHFVKSTESLALVREQFEKAVNSEATENSSLKSLSKLDLLQQVLTLDTL